MGDGRIFNQMQDFFFNNTTNSSNKISSNSSMLDDHNHMIKKETSHDEDHDHHDHTNIDIGLNLFPSVAASSGSKTISTSNKESIDKLTVLKSEVERINAENQHLRYMLNQVGNNCRALQGHILGLSHKQQYGNNTHSRLATNNFKLANKEKCNMSNDQNREVRDGFLKSKDADDDLDHDRKDDQTKMVRRARVSVRTRSGESMISDGCQWRKYGQKMSKGNPCPRAYYRCTMAIGCPVRKQVQRCLEEQSILITTYEGNHNHPLPPSAMEMASTTSAAASMLLSGSIQSADRNHHSLVNSSNNHLLSRTMLPYLPPNMASISSSTPFPTITLDLTTTSNGSQTIGSKVSNMFPQNISLSHEALVPNSYMNTNTNKIYNSTRFPFRDVDEQNQQMMDVVTTALASDPNFAATIAAAVSSIINNSGKNTQRNDNME